MSDVTCMSLVPKDKRLQLRRMLAADDGLPIKWRERKRLFVSEFYFTGPSRDVMRTHSYVSHWLATGKTPEQRTTWGAR